MKSWLKNKLSVSIAVVIILAGGLAAFLIVRESPKECVQRELIAWLEKNRGEFSDSSSSSGIEYPKYDRNDPKSTTARVKTIARFPLSDSSERTRRIVLSLRLILEQCGIDY